MRVLAGSIWAMTIARQATLACSTSSTMPITAKSSSLMKMNGVRVDPVDAQRVGGVDADDRHPVGSGRVATIVEAAGEQM